MQRSYCVAQAVLSTGDTGAQDGELVLRQLISCKQGKYQQWLKPVVKEDLSEEAMSER